MGVAHYRASIEAIEGARSRLLSPEYRTISYHIGPMPMSESSISSCVRGGSREALHYAEASRARVFRETLSAARVKSDEVKPVVTLEVGSFERRMGLRKAVLVEYSLGTDHSYVWAVTAGKTVAATLPPRADIERAVAIIPASIDCAGRGGGDCRRPAVSDAPCAIASEMVPKRPWLSPRMASCITLPFEALVTDKGSFLAENFTVSYTPSASAFGEFGPHRGEELEQGIAWRWVILTSARTVLMREG